MGWLLLLYGTFRFLLWGAGVGLALFPTVWAMNGALDHYWLWQINLDGRFRDLFFVLAPAAALSMTTTLDFIWSDHTSRIARNAAILVLLANIGILISGFVGFQMIPDGNVLGGDQFGFYSKLIEVGLVISLATELWVSVASERKRELLERNWNDLNRVRERVRHLERHGTTE